MKYNIKAMHLYVHSLWGYWTHENNSINQCVHWNFTNLKKSFQLGFMSKETETFSISVQSYLEVMPWPAVTLYNFIINHAMHCVMIFFFFKILHCIKSCKFSQGSKWKLFVIGPVYIK